MSQPTNYQYLSYADSTGSLKGGPPPMANGQPSAMHHTPNGVQPSFNSAGTPSSQSSRDPSRETSRDPSPTQYLHNQYRPQLLRPPMPPINGSQTAISDVATSTQPRALPPRQSAPMANPQQNTSNQFGHVQSGNAVAYVPQTTQASAAIAAAVAPSSAAAAPTSTAQSLSSSSAIETGNQLRRTVTPTKYDFPSPQRTVTVDSGSKINAESQARPNPNSQIVNPSVIQHLPNPSAAQSSIQSQSQSDWRRENSFPSSMLNVSNPTQASTNTNQTWSNPIIDPNFNNSSSNPQPYTGHSAIHSQPNVSTSNTMKDSSSSVPNNSTTMGSISNQTWVNPNIDGNVNSRIISQSYPSNVNQTVGSSSMSQIGFSQNTNFAPPPVSGATTQNIPSYLRQTQQQLPINKINLTNPVGNANRSPQTSNNQASNVVPVMNSSSQNIFASTTINQHQSVSNQGFNQKPTDSQIFHPSLANPQSQYPPSQHGAVVNQPNLSGPVTIGPHQQPNQSTYGSQQNLTSQRKYPQPSYGTQPLMGGQNVAGSPLGIPNNSAVSPSVPGQIPMRPPGPGAPPLPGQQPQSRYDLRAPYLGQMSNVPLDNMGKRYPAPSYPDQMNQMNNQMGNLNVTQSGFNELWGQQSVDLLQCRNILPPEKVEPPRIKLHQEFLDSINCSSEIFRCTLTKIPESNSLLQKCRLPLGVLIHPFKDLNHLPVIQCSTIVRCRACRTYINPFVHFVDSKRWKCNLCYRVNELPEEFQFDPVTKSYGDPSRRPEVKTSTIEFIAPSEYMLRPPQPAVYLFLLDVSRLAVETGYLTVVCETIAEELTKLPGDGRTQVGFIAIDSTVHFFSMPENVSQPHELIMLDVDDIFLPCPDNLIVNLKEREELIRDLLAQLPTKFNGTHDTNSALGAGLQAAFKLMSPTGGRVTVFQTCLPNLGPGALQAREDPNSRASKDVPHLNPATDFYKRLALDCSGQQIAVDLFLLNSQYSDLATLSGMCKFSGGCMYHIPLFRTNKPQHSETLEKMLRRYLTRKIGFEAVMRIRCTRGLSIHTFHGNFFVRSTDLLSLPNVNPDAGFGMQVSIEENLSDVQSVCFQAALLYTSSKGERRIRVHTLCLPVSSSMSDILFSADQQGMVGLLSKMAVDRSQQSSLSDARDALINVAIDVLSAYKLSQSAATGGLLAPGNLKLLPLYIIALIKCIAFRSGTSTRLDDRVFAMCQMKALPLSQLIQMIYPDLYPVHALDDNNSKDIDGKFCPQPPRLHLSAEKLDFRGVFLMDAGDQMYIYIGKNIDPTFCNNIFGVQAFTSIPEELYDLPELDTVESERLRNFVFSLQEEKPYYAPLQIIRDDSHFRSLFIDRLIEDRFESALSYHEFLQHLKTQVK